MIYREFFVDVVASPSRTLYIGVTNDLERRVWEHRNKVLGGFTAKYNVSRLVYVEVYPRIDDAIAREKQLKNWNRAKKVALIERENPDWHDLSRDWPIGGLDDDTADVATRQRIPPTAGNPSTPLRSARDDEREQAKVEDLAPHVTNGRSERR